MYKQPQVYYVDLQKLNDELFFESICSNMQNSYYWSDDWSTEFYITLAKKGFISTTYDTKGGLVLLPELQYDYAVLDFEDLHISKKVKKLLVKDNYKFTIDTKFDEVLDSFEKFHKYNWLKGRYVELLKSLHLQKRDDFKLFSVEVSSKDDEVLIAGEVGYMINNIYTSLTGFSLREKYYNNYGKLQMVLLAKYLEENGVRFWNLGHPHMSYKIDLGAKIYTRSQFLKRWESCEI